MNKILISALKKVQEGEKTDWRIPGPRLSEEEKKEYLKFKKSLADSQRKRRQRRAHQKLNSISRVEDLGFIMMNLSLDKL